MNATKTRRAGVLALALALGSAQACGTADLNTNPTQFISVALSSLNATVHQGGSTTATITVTGSGGFNSKPLVSLLEVPVGVTGSVSPIGTTANTSTGTFSLTAELTEPPGVYPVRVQVTGSGVATVLTTFTLTIIH